MKIEQRGFRIADISERVAGVDGEDGELLIVFVDPNGGEDLSPWLRLDDVKALREALTVACGLMAGDTTPAPEPTVDDSLPASVTDGQGDVWHRIGGTRRYVVTGDGCTLEYIARSYGLSD